MKSFCAGLTVLGILLAILIVLATPRKWPFGVGELKAKKVLIEGQPFIKIEGDPMNYIGQIQSLNVVFDPSVNRIIVSRCRIQWNPLTKITINNQWPVIFPLDFLKPGKYAVVYQTKNGENIAATFDMP